MLCNVFASRTRRGHHNKTKNLKLRKAGKLGGKKGTKGSSEAWRTAKGGLTLALELAENVLDGLPIPGVKGSIGAVIKIIKRIDVSEHRPRELLNLRLAHYVVVSS